MLWKRSVALAVGMVLLVAGCAGGQPTEVPASAPRTITSVPASLTDNPRINPDKQEVFDTGCDFPVLTKQEGVLTLGEYQVEVKLRRSDVVRCNTLHWVYMKPVNLPSGERSKDFAAVLRIGQPDGKMDAATFQRARPSNPMVELITKGRTIEPGERLQACLYLLKNDELSDAFICANEYTVPAR